jgi:hypothetical protein
MRLARAAFALTCLVALARPAHAGDPSLRWRTLETEHFHIHYYQGEEAFARGLAVRAERAHALIAPILAHAPSGKTHIVVTDDVDTANGSATVLPYNLVHLYAAGPDGESLLSDFDDWSNVLVTHEYSHILHLDNVSGVATFVNLLLGLGMGKVYAPNQVQPRWFIEGLATYEESTRTTGGRARSNIADMYLRVAAFEGLFQRLDQVSSGTLLYPHGSTAYLYGAFFLKYIADRFGEEALARVSRIYGGAPIPFGLNRAISDATGEDYETLWNDFYAALFRRYELQRAEVDVRGRSRAWRITYHGEDTDFPHNWPGSNDIVYLRQDGYDRPTVMRMPAQGGPARAIYRMISGGVALPTPDGKTLVTAELETCNTNYLYYDLFRVDLASGHREPLTHCARALDPDLSPDGKWVTYAINLPGGAGSDLAVIATAGGPPRVLVHRGDGYARVFSPVWSPDGKSVAFSEWTEGGFRDLVVIDVATGHLARLTHDRALDVTPRYSPDGRYLLFASDRTGIFNIYAYELATARLLQVTNVLDGAFEPTVSEAGDTLVYRGFTARGYDLFAMRYAPSEWLPALPFATDRDDAPLTELNGSPDAVVRGDHPYSAWATAHPWRIAGASVVPGPFSQLITLDLSGTDATNIHNWQLHLEQGLGGRGETNEVVAYTWDRLWAPISASFSHRTVQGSGLVIAGRELPYPETQYNSAISAQLPVVRQVDHNVTVGVNYHYNHFSSADPLHVPLDPNQAISKVPEQGALAGLGVSFGFSNVRRYAFSVTPAEGRQLSFNLNLDSDVLGGDFRTVETDWGYTEYLPVPWTLRQVLLLSYSGGIAQGNLHRRGLFFAGGFGANIPLDSVLLCALQVRTTGCSSGNPPLRGFAPGAFSGDQFHVATAEYRFAVAELERGVSTLPVYANRLVGAVYADYGNAFRGSADLSNFHLGVGGEVGVNFTLGYVEGASLRLGYARGVTDGGTNQVYFQLALGQLY